MQCTGSERNTSTLTFDGVDVMGERLADEVGDSCHMSRSISVISFVCDDFFLGGECKSVFSTYM